MATDMQDSVNAHIGSLAGVDVETIDLKLDFLDLAARFAHLPGTVVLLSGGELDCARYHIMGALPWLTLAANTRQVTVRVGQHTHTVESHPLDLLRSVMTQLALPQGDWPAPLAAGLLGYLSYDLKDCLEQLPRTTVDDATLPHMLLYAHALLVVHDTQAQTTRLMVPRRKGGAPGADQGVARFYALAAEKPPPSHTFGVNTDRMASNFSRPAYLAAVQQVLDYITAGDLYQVNLSQRFQVPFSGDGFSLFRHLFQQNPAPFFAYVQAGDHQIVSTSPERFLLRSGARVETRPIKGTRPRGETAQEDQAMRQELARSAKDDAELSMIVDLLRNDIGKVCAPASVRVVEHKRLEAYQNVYHLVSVVTGELDAGKDSVDLIQAAFPGGSITGCPKVRAMEIIDELESCRRHIYCGSIGYLSFHDTMDLSIAIRTATIVNDTLSFSVGGGIVFDSDPQSEYEETLHKGRTLMDACQGRRVQSAEPMVWFNGRLMPARQAAVPVSDQGVQYGYGFFETIRVDSGGAPLLAGHAQRFERTWRALMPSQPPDLTWQDIISQVIRANDLQARCAAVKLLVTRGSRTAAPWDHALLVTARPYTHRLTALGIQGLSLGTYPHAHQSPLADHKTLNYLYYLQAGQWGLQNGFHEALILNPDGTIAETHTANLLLIDGNTVVRPQSPAVLPGVMAQAICDQLHGWGYAIVQRPVQPQELIAAPLVLATNALMGAVPVVRIDGRPRPADGALWQALNDALIPAWRAG
jgi:para-aminobenzoate synthetase component I